MINKTNKQFVTLLLIMGDTIIRQVDSCNKISNLKQITKNR